MIDYYAMLLPVPTQRTINRLVRCEKYIPWAMVAATVTGAAMVVASAVLKNDSLLYGGLAMTVLSPVMGGIGYVLTRSKRSLAELERCLVQELVDTVTRPPFIPPNLYREPQMP